MKQDSINFDDVTRSLSTKSDKIRALAREGATTADIARYLGIRYQHARNVLVSSGLHNRQREPGANGTTTQQPQGNPSGWVTIDAIGRLQVPVNVMKAAGIAGDEPVHVRVGSDGIEVLSRRAALRRAHEIARRFVPEGVSLVDELIAERRREAAREND